MAEVVGDFPGLKVIATSLRQVGSASRNDWGGICWAEVHVVSSPVMANLKVFDRVGGRDSFASGVIFGLLEGVLLDQALQYGVAHGALAMSSPGGTSMVTLPEVRRLVQSGSARVVS